MTRVNSLPTCTCTRKLRNCSYLFPPLHLSFHRSTFNSNSNVSVNHTVITTLNLFFDTVSYMRNKQRQRQRIAAKIPSLPKSCKSIEVWSNEEYDLEGFRINLFKAGSSITVLIEGTSEIHHMETVKWEWVSEWMQGNIPTWTSSMEICTITCTSTMSCNTVHPQY